jgi:hypothetical protein
MTLDVNVIDWGNSEAAPTGLGVIVDIRAFLDRFVVLTPEQGDTISLWVLHTHAFGAADTTPYLHVTSPVKQSGKTRLLECLELLVARAWFTSRASAAVLYRKVDRDGPTLLLDESDAAFKVDSEYSEALRAILNAGFRKGGKCTVCVGQGANFEPKDFDVFSPKAIAGIGRLPDTVADRSIVIELKRRRVDERIERFRERDVRAESMPLRNRVAAWSQSACGRLLDARPEIPGELRDRAADVWEPLLAIADDIGGSWPARARRAALMLSGAAEATGDSSLSILLLGDLRSLFDERDDEAVSSSNIVERLATMEDRPWPELSKGKPITTNALARLLKPFGPKPHDMRIGQGGKTLKCYSRAAFEDAFGRYLPIKPQQPRQANETGPKLTIPGCASGDVVADRKTAVSSMNPALVADVAVESPKDGALEF